MKDYLTSWGAALAGVFELLTPLRGMVVTLTAFVLLNFVMELLTKFKQSKKLTWKCTLKKLGWAIIKSLIYVCVLYMVQIIDKQMLSNTSDLHLANFVSAFLGAREVFSFLDKSGSIIGTNVLIDLKNYLSKKFKIDGKDETE